jgi:hypothetical protein
VSTVTITPASGSVIQGRTLQLAATFHDAEGNAVSGGTVTWSSSSRTIAAVSTSGMVTGVAVGNASITATANGKSKSAAIAVTGSTSGSTPAPPPPPTSPTPPPTTTQTACTQIPHSRLVAVSTSSELHSALSSAQPGDLIQLADGSYGDGSEFRLTASGTASQRITVCGTSNAVVNAGSLSGRDGMKLTGANYATLSGFTITNALFGVWVERSIHVLLQGLTVHSIGQEGIEIVAFSKNAVVSNNRIYDTGRVVAEYGEGIYIGSANAKWAALTGGQPDATDSVLIEGNNIGPDVRAEHIDAKEGTTGGIIRNNTFNGSGMIESQGTGESGWPNSWVILQGVGYHVQNNTGSNALSAGFRVVTHGTVMTGLNNSFSSNSFDVGGAPYGFLIQTGSGTNGNGNVVSCDNSVRNASVGMANVACR